MEIINIGGWVFYVSENVVKFDRHKCGKWMYFFGDRQFAEKICREAVEKGVVTEAKHTDAEGGVACFYLESDDIASHKRTIQYFLDNDLIRRSKTGKLYNIAFKLDDQTRAG